MALNTEYTYTKQSRLWLAIHGDNITFAPSRPPHPGLSNIQPLKTHWMVKYRIMFTRPFRVTINDGH